MKKTIKNFILAVSVLLLLNACDCIKGEGPVISETRDLKNFDGIELDLSARVFLKKSENYSFRIEAQENILQEIRTDMKGGLLRIRYEDYCVNSHKGIRIFIEMPELTEVYVDGSGDVSGDGSFTCDDLKLKVSGSGSVDLNAVADFVECIISGSGEIDLGGQAKELEITIRGSGDVNALRSEAEEAYIKINGSGDSRVYVTRRLEVDIAGSGDVFYKGNPDIMSDINGSGDLRKLR